MDLNGYNIKGLLETVRENEEKADKFHAIETKILSVLNFKALFEVLLFEIKNQFRVPFAWLSIIRDTEVSAMMLDALKDSKTLKEDLHLIDKQTFLRLTGNDFGPLLINKDLGYYYKLFPDDRKFLAKSMGIAPITLDGEMIGSLNQADIRRERFSPDLDPGLIRQLAVKVSLCLSNVYAHEKIKYMAYHDPLTGILNRRVIENILEREYERSDRYGSPLSLVFMDLDYFKRVNDNYGHEQGDRLLKYLAENLIRMSRQSDIVGRFAGDEFVAVLPETDLGEAKIQMNRIRQWFMENPLMAGETAIPVSISFGIASTGNDQAGDVRELLKIADERLYEVKRERDQ